MDLHLGGVTLLDADVSLSDYALAAETLFLRARLARTRPGADSFARHGRGLFLALCASSLLGGTFHGFFPGNTVDPVGRGLWIATVLTLGLIAVQLWLLAACIALPLRWVKRISVGLGVAFAAYAYVVIAVDHSFRTGIVFYLPSTLALLVTSGWKFAATREPAFAYGALGLSITLGAAALQQMHVEVPALHLTHNTLFHLLEGVAFGLMYRFCAGVQMGSRAGA